VAHRAGHAGVHALLAQPERRPGALQPGYLRGRVRRGGQGISSRRAGSGTSPASGSSSARSTDHRRASSGP
jgi:hypothetical protein